jgi:hypothetical protein
VIVLFLITRWRGGSVSAEELRERDEDHAAVA